MVAVIFGAGAVNQGRQAPATTAESAVARGEAAYAAGRIEEALESFEAAIARAPDSAIARYNAAAALFQLKRYAQARERYQEARLRAGAVLRTKIDYALGNTALCLGEISAAIAAYDECLGSTAGDSSLARVRQDAAVNRRFAIEQAQSPAVADSESPDGRSPSPRQSGRKGQNPRANDDGSQPDGQADTDTQGGGAGSDADQANERTRPPTGRRRTGGGGGTGNTQQGNRGDTPDDRLDAALENIREAVEHRRLPEELPPESPVEGKDW
jgi:Ca-activated chloride channel family protein